MKVQTIIDERLKEENNKKRERSGKISPSSLGRCYRYQIWYRDDVEPTNPPEINDFRKFAIGNIIHEWIQEHFDKDNVEVLCETDDVKGYCDLVNDDTCIDIKSQHSKSFWYMKNCSKNIYEDKKNNWLQVLFYADFLNKEHIQLTFVSKDDGEMMEYNLNTKDYVQDLYDELAVLRKYWKDYKETGELPTAEARAYGGKDCEFCQYASKCISLVGNTHKLCGELKKLEDKELDAKRKNKKLTGKEGSRLNKLREIVNKSNKAL